LAAPFSINLTQVRGKTSETRRRRRRDRKYLKLECLTLKTLEKSELGGVAWRNSKILCAGKRGEERDILFYGEFNHLETVLQKKTTEIGEESGSQGKGRKGKDKSREEGSPLL